jgi:hypothetical protein
MASAVTSRRWLHPSPTWQLLQTLGYCGQ